MASDPSSEWASRLTPPPRNPARYRADDRGKHQTSVTEEEITHSNEKGLGSSTTLTGDDNLHHPERKDSNSSLTSTQLDSYTNDPNPFATNAWARYSHFLGLIVTTTLIIIIVIGNFYDYTVPVGVQRWIEDNDSNVTMIVQIAATLLGYLMAVPFTGLINQGTRLVFQKKGATLNKLWFWFNVCNGSFTWHLPLKLWIYLVIFIFIFVGPSAIWAPALTPTPVILRRSGSIAIPSYENRTFIREYPLEFNRTLTPQDVRDPRGFFSYRVGITQQGAILASASSATTVDGNPQTSPKLDNTGFVYFGRSYGVGASPGLADDIILNNQYAKNYSYEETGYNTRAKCAYNASSLFSLQPADGSGKIFDATGLLPDSNGKIEHSTYFGNGDASIMAIGVASEKSLGTSRLLSIAAGSNYAALNRIQCVIEFVPTVFNVAVNITSRNITVTPLPEKKPTEIDPDGTLQFVATRQIALISQDQTNFHQSFVGNSFLSSIGNYNVSKAKTTLMESASTIEGVQNSVTAMLDTILSSYASAQIMIASQTVSTPVTISIRGLGFGTLIQPLAVAFWNFILILLFVEEAIRTRGWRDLHGWDYGDIRSIILSSSRGGRKLADHMASREVPKKKKWKSSGIVKACLGHKARFDKTLGMTRVGLVKATGALVLREEKEVKKKRFWRRGKRESQ